MARPDWVAWHESYDDPDSPLSRRLDIVQAQIRTVLDDAPVDPIHVVSMCAGQGRDLLGVLADHPRRDDVEARLVELDPHNCDVARSSIAVAKLETIEVVEGDAGVSDAYVGAVPAHLVLVCGVFGQIEDAAIERLVGILPTMCSSGATVIWTRHRLDPDLTPSIRGWFGDASFEEIAFVAPDGYFFAVGAHRFAGTPAPLEPGVPLFEFTKTVGS